MRRLTFSPPFHWADLLTASGSRVKWFSGIMLQMFTFFRDRTILW